MPNPNRPTSPLPAWPSVSKPSAIRPDCRVAGCLSYGTPVNRRYTPPTWHVTAPLGIAERVAVLLEGQLSHPGTIGMVEVTTQVTELAIYLSGSEAVQLRWRRGSSRDFCGDGDGVDSCICPFTVMARRRAARLGNGCEPHVQVWLRLVIAPTLGHFVFMSGNWSFAEEVLAAASMLSGRHGLIRASLSLNRVGGTLSTGQAVAFSRPVLTIPNGGSPSGDGGVFRGLLTCLSSQEDPHSLLERNPAPSC